MQLTFMDFLAILEIVLILFVSGFALLVPLYAYLKNFKLALKVCIPISFAVEILIGYIFYLSGHARIFPLVYLLFILLINIILSYKLRLPGKIGSIRIKFNWKMALAGFLIIASVIYLRFYDALLNIAPGAIDAAAHAQYVLDIVLYGRLSSAYYAPGFHILIYPITYLVDMVNTYRFAGPVLGSMTMLSIYLLFKDFFKNKLSLYFMILAFGLPIFSILTLQTISFFPTVLTFIFFPMLIYIPIKPNELEAPTSLIFYTITMIGLVLTVPYALVQFIPAIVLLFIIAFSAIRIIGKDYIVFLSKILVIALSGFILAFGLVYLQNRISQKEGYDGFPQIAIAENHDSGMAPSTNIEKTSAFLENQKGPPGGIKNNAVFRRYFVPMLMTGGDVISVKEVRSLGSIVAVFAYLWIGVSVIMIYLGIRRKDLTLLVFGSFIFVFGVATQTGIFEMSTYRGRSGWYLLLFVLLSTIYFLDMIIKRIPKTVSYVLLAILLVASFVSPPTFYRGYFPEYFAKAREISRQFPNQKILLITDKWRIVTVSKNFSYNQFKPNTIGNTCEFDQCFLIFSKKFFDLDPVKSQKLIVISRDLKDFEINQAALKKAQEENIETIKKSQNFSKYKIYWENENLSIYKLQN